MIRPAAAAGMVALVVISAAAGFFLSRAHHAPRPAESEQPASKPAEASPVGGQRPEFTLRDVDGVPRQVSEWDGKVIVLNFWATWCPPCRKEIPEFVELQHRYGNRGLQFVGVALENVDTVRPFMAEMQMNYPVLVGQESVIPVARAYGDYVGALPFTAIIDRKGRIVYARAGPLPGEKAEAIIAPLL